MSEFLGRWLIVAGAMVAFVALAAVGIALFLVPIYVGVTFGVWWGAAAALPCWSLLLAIMGG